MSAISSITGNDMLTTRHILAWFAKQAEDVQIQIMRRKYREFMRLRNVHPKISNPALDLASLVLAAHDEGMRLGWIRDNDVREAHSMHIGYVHHLRNALHKAMSWLSPEPQVGFRNLEESYR